MAPTDLLYSMKYDVGVGGFVGARTEIVPATLNNPPGVAYVLFDLTLPAAYPDTFANMGITLFGHDLNAGGGISFGNQVQFLDELLMAPLGAGTHLNQRIDLDFALGPYGPSVGKSFNEIFGTDDDDLERRLGVSVLYQQERIDADHRLHRQRPFCRPGASDRRLVQPRCALRWGWLHVGVAKLQRR